MGCQEPQPATDPADLILLNGQVYTFAWTDPTEEGLPATDAPFRDGVWTPEAEAIAIRAGRIVKVGSSAEMEAWRGPSTEVIDVRGGTVLPGAVESHGHLQQIGEWHEEIDLRGLDTEQAIVDLVATRAREVPEGEWIVGAGWDEGAWANRLPTMELLSERVPDHPVCLKGLRGFGTWGNRRAFKAAGISRSTPTPDGGEILRNGDGDATGILLNNATDLLNGAVPERSLAQKKRILRYGLEQLAAAGYVGAHHAGTRLNYMPAYESLADEGQLLLRVETMLAAEEGNRALLDEWLEKGPTPNRGAMLQVRSIKAFYDGSLGSRGARLLEEYSDQPGHHGVSGSEYGFDEELVARLMKAGFQAGIHATGDAGNRAVLDFFEQVYGEAPDTR
ncbi:MAG: amidohydrolase family protein, partial [Thermoanaerobaculia bacterium]|nr:amidohydrolase family protein [Thermoanaerobaculia bacterium]